MRYLYHYGIAMSLLFLLVNVSAQSKIEIQQRLDSSKTYSYKSKSDSSLVATWKYQYFKDGSDSCIQNKGFNINLNKWATLSKSVFFKDKNGYDTARIDTNKYGSPEKKIMTYNTNGKLTSNAYYGWNVQDKIWFGYTKTEYTFDSIVNDSVQYEREWDFQHKKWIPFKFYQIKTNALGQRQRRTEYYSYGDTIKVLYYKTEYLNDNYNRDTLSILCFTPTHDFLTWNQMIKESQKYDNNGNLVDWQQKAYFTLYNYWYLANRYTYTYDNNKLKIKSTFCRDDSVGIKQFEINRTVYEYDKKGVNTKQTYYEIDSLHTLQLSSITYLYHSLGNVKVPEVLIPPIDTVKPKPITYISSKKLLRDSVLSFEYTSKTDSTLVQSKHIEYDSLGNRTTLVYNYAKGISYLESKKYEVFDNADNVIIAEDYIWNSGDKCWIGNSKVTMKYDNNHKILSNSYSQWETGINSWIEISKYETLLDNKNRVSTVSEYNWKDYYENSTKTHERKYSYNTDGTLAQITTKTFDKNLLHNDSLITFTYNKPGNNFTESYLIWNADSLKYINDYKLEHIINANNPRESVIKYWNDINTKKWIVSDKKDYYKDNSGRDTSVIFYSAMDSVNWYSYSKTFYTYDKNGNKTLEENDFWNGADSTWIGNSKIDRTYNNNELQSEHEYYYDYYAKEWIFTHGKENTYDNKDRHQSQSSLFWDQDSLHIFIGSMNKYHYQLNDSLLFTENYYHTTNQGLVIGTKDFYYFTTHNVKIVDTTTIKPIPTSNPIIATQSDSLQIKIYPNPTHDYVKIDCDIKEYSTITIYSIDGKCIISVPVQEHTTTIPLNQLNAGIWIIKVEGNNSVVGRIIEIQ